MAANEGERGHSCPPIPKPPGLESPGSIYPSMAGNEGEWGQSCPPIPKPPGPESPGSIYNPQAEILLTKNHLPHWQQGQAWVFITWRLGDSLPQKKRERWREERSIWLKVHPKPWDRNTENASHERFSTQIEDWLDRASGSCLLRDPENARIVAGALQHFDGVRYELATFVVMPNQVHVLFRPLNGHVMAEIVKSWKGYTAREINKRGGKTGPLWQEDYWDRLIRSGRHFHRVAGYIRDNPVVARLGQEEFVLWEMGG